MATGTGKTFTAFQIIWRLWKSKAKKRILFLADRNILVNQAMTNDFKPFGSAMTDVATILRPQSKNRIRTIRGSLAIEGNTLSEKQITAILDGKRIIAPPREIQEARNAIAAYDRLKTWRPEMEPHLLEAYRVMMDGLIDDAGVYRRGGVGVIKGGQVIQWHPWRIVSTH